MLITTLIILAIALVAVVFLLRSGSVAPKDWAKRHDTLDESNDGDR
jgi:hypothetical protein